MNTINDPLFDDQDNEPKVMWEHDYERSKDEERAKAHEARARKAKEDEIARELRQEQFKIKNKLNYTEMLAQEICERISAGELLINICNDEHMPTIRRCNQWLKTNDDFNATYKDSLNDRLSIFEEEVIKIADDAARDMKEIIKSGRAIKVQDAEVIARAKLRVEVRFRHLKAGRPNKWGETSTLITKSDDDDTMNLSLQDLEKKIADLEIKDNVVKAI